MAKKASDTLSVASASMQKITFPTLLQFLDISPDAMIVINQAGTIVRTNSHALSLFGYTSLELWGQPLNVLLPERFRVAHAIHREHYFSAPLTRSMGVGLQLFGQRKNGTEFPVDISLQPILIDNVLHGISTVYDVTRYKALVEAEQYLNNELEHLNTLQSNFISVIDHEFRTALTSIEGFSGLLRDEDHSSADVKDYANDIYTDALRLHAMITNLLDLEQMQQGKMQLNLQWIDINALLTRITQSMGLTTIRHTFHLHLDQIHPQIEGDENKLIQVITNLLSNAVKYSPEGGDIVITTSVEGAFIHLSIQDHGIGIAHTIIKDIFMPYHHIDAKATRHIQGTGLGLPIVKQIVEMHQGHIWVESVPGQGSLFHLLFPLRLRSTTL
jgi:protein-histidine pros-kinase